MKTFSFWIVEHDGEMRCVQVIWCSHAERKEKFEKFKEYVKDSYPDSLAAWMTGDPQGEARDLQEKVDELQAQENNYSVDWPYRSY